MCIIIIDMSLTLQTTHGNIKIELFCELCPKACKNFLALAASGRYDNTIFHRNIKGTHYLMQVLSSKEATLQERENRAKVSTANHFRTSSFRASNTTVEESSPWPTADPTPTAANSLSPTTGCPNSTNSTLRLERYK
jgi:cyclophilin family peptidyl-prolyl cis-trans isomerase